MDIVKIFRWIVLAALALAFVVVVFGAFVRLSDAGLGCPDWPGCYGHVSVPGSEAALSRAQERFPGSVVESRKAWIEMIHRYLAGTLGILVLAIAVLAWRHRATLRQSPVLPTAMVALVVVQALFGMWTVTLKLMPLIVTLHLLGGMTTLALLAWLAARQRASQGARHSIEPERSRVRRWAAIGLAVLAMQIALGGWVSTNYAGMACTDVPLCHGTVLPSMDFGQGFSLWRELGVTAAGTPLSNEALNAIQWAHRIGAIATVGVLALVGLLTLVVRSVRPFGVAVLVLALLQAGIGIANVVHVLPVPLAVAHNAGAALLLVTLVMLNFKARQAPRPEF